MFHACAVRFDVTDNLKKFWVVFGLEETFLDPCRLLDRNLLEACDLCLGWCWYRCNVFIYTFGQYGLSLSLIKKKYPR